MNPVSAPLSSYSDRTHFKSETVRTNVVQCSAATSGVLSVPVGTLPVTAVVESDDRPVPPKERSLRLRGDIRSCWRRADGPTIPIVPHLSSASDTHFF